ncbi:MAG: response regulator [Gammaproteobacteria bacterium]|jgi:two-component system chemotaxis response regulator CheY|nr:response regulator [Gammaproteobacteria bacterium]
MIADDEQTMRTLLGDLLRWEGCEVVAKAADGLEAYDLFKTKKPEIIFLDINMPQEDGIGALKKIRADDPKVFICMVSADAYPETVKEAVAQGVSGFIVKPLSQTRVHDVVTNFLNKRNNS